MRIFLATVICLLFITACKKSSTENNNPVNTGPLLSKFFVLDTSLPATIDTTEKIFITYDAQNRPATYSLMQFYYGDTTGKLDRSYQYTGNNSYATKTVTKYTSYSSGVPTDVTYETGDYTFANGQLTYDTIYRTDRFEAHNYSYNGNTISYKEHFHNGGDNELSNANFYQTISGDNITHQLDTLITATNGTLYYQRSDVTSSYVNHPNPFYLVISPMKSTLELWDYTIENLFSTDKNLIDQRSVDVHSWTSSNSSMSSTHQSYSYTYGSNAFPTRAVATLSSGSSTQVYTLVFQY